MAASILIYDGDCGVCTRLSRVVTTTVRRRQPDFAVSAYQDADLPALGLTPEECDEALRWVDSRGRVSSAQDAVARVLLAGRLPFKPLGALILLPGINALAGVVYRWVALNRHRLPGGTPACSLPAAQRPS
jgi:predicted DCC family thiol-disulfide oxidoreductase YuxK